MQRILKFTHSTVLDSYPFAAECRGYIKTITECAELMDLYSKDSDLEECIFKTESKIESAIIAIENYLYS